MGYETACSARIDGKPDRGKALLETRDLIFRGAERLVIPIASIKTATANNGRLEVRFGSREASFDVGPQADRWARRITNPPSRLDKLGVKPGFTVALVGWADGAFADELVARGARVSRRAPSRSAPANIIFFGATRRDALERLAALRQLIVDDGAIWVVRPKGVDAITERDTMAAGKRAGLVDVKVISFSDTHTAEKFVIPVGMRRAKIRRS
jgi:hypothetical protein